MKETSKERIEQIIANRNRTNKFANLIGLKTTEIGKGYCRTELQVREELLNPMNAVHGGVLFTILDVTGGGAASYYGNQVTTANADIHFLRAGLHTDKLYGYAKELKAGKRLLVYEVEVKDQGDTVLAAGIYTYASLGMPIPEE